MNFAQAHLFKEPEKVLNLLIDALFTDVGYKTAIQKNPNAKISIANEGMKVGNKTFLIESEKFTTVLQNHKLNKQDLNSLQKLNINFIKNMGLPIKFKEAEQFEQPDIVLNLMRNVVSLSKKTDYSEFGYDKDVFSITNISGMLYLEEDCGFDLNMSIDVMELDLSINKLTQKDQKTLLDIGEHIFKDTYFIGRDYNKDIKFKEPSSICDALMSASNVRNVKNASKFKRITDPIMLIHYIFNENEYVDFNENIFKDNLANLSESDAIKLMSVEFKLGNGVYNMSDLLGDEMVRDLQDQQTKNEITREEIRKQQDLDSVPDITKPDYLAQRMMFYLGELTDFDKWFLKEYGSSVQQIAKKLKEKDLSVEQLEKLSKSIETLDSGSINALIVAGEKQSAMISGYINEGKKEIEKFKNEKINLEEKAKTIEDELTKKYVSVKEEIICDVNKWKQEIQKRLSEIRSDAESVRKVEFIIKQGKNKKTLSNDVLRHAKYEETMTDVSAGLSPFLVGPAGSGKSTILKQIAYDLELPYCPMPVNGQTSEYSIIGYNDAQGKYVRTAFRNAYENGGVFLFEEIDAGNPNVMTVINNTIGQDCYMFPDGKTVQRHNDFIVGASANTYGRGASLQYIGRNPLDAATIDRFSFTDVYYDTVLEEMLCNIPIWRDYVYEIRRITEQFNMRVVASTRAIVNGCALLNAGVNYEKVAQKVIWKGTAAEDVEKVKQSINRNVLSKISKMTIQKTRGGIEISFGPESDEMPF